MRQQGLPQASRQETEKGHWLRTSVFFYVCLAFVVIVSIVDANMVVVCKTLPEEEYNPIGKLLIAEQGQSGFFVVKMIGTGAVVLTLVFLKKFWRPAAQLAVGMLALFQLLLMVYIFS